ncbi:hypothetical protein ACSLVQ_29930, partial [Klebsiella pneumoniae]|uniref:hypothetical protein n=1 Tax=Klebsiella pneumoniae TaxID=573 RepID=UPI003EE3596F
MKKKLFILCLLITTFSCKQNNNNEAPKAIEEIIKVDVPSSTFNLPVTYPIKNLQTFINKL